MGAILASTWTRATALLGTLIFSLLASFGLPDLDKIRELLKRIQEILVLGGMALATVASGVFLVAWVLSHLRKPKTKSSGGHLLPWVALVSSYVPVGLTVAAAAGMFVPGLAPFMLKCFSLAVLLAAFSWALSVAALLMGGSPQDLQRARRALLLAGTPWYCLAAYLSRFL